MEIEERGRDQLSEKSNLENLEILLRAIDYALLLSRSDEFSEIPFLPNTCGQNKEKLN